MARNKSSLIETRALIHRDLVSRVRQLAEECSTRAGCRIQYSNLVRACLLLIDRHGERVATRFHDQEPIARPPNNNAARIDEFDLDLSYRIEKAIADGHSERSRRSKREV